MAYTRKRTRPAREAGEKWLPDFTTSDCKTALYVRVPAWMPLRLDEVAESMTGQSGQHVTRTDLVRMLIIELLEKHAPKAA
jgi:hypothetical protein